MENHILQSLEPAGFQLLPNYPNPFNAGTQIPLRLNRDSEVTLTIFDILGRKVATLHRGRLSAGQHVFHWDGHNGDGFPVGSGNYLLILENSEHSSVRKLNLVK